MASAAVIVVPSWKSDGRNVYVILTAACALGETGRHLPSEPGISAPAGTRSTASIVHVTRLAIHPLRYGAGSRAGSPTASHNIRPNASVNPASGFQAAVAAALILMRSTPFQGKSFSLTVRKKIAEFSPVCPS